MGQTPRTRHFMHKSWLRGINAQYQYTCTRFSHSVPNTLLPNRFSIRSWFNGGQILSTGQFEFLVEYQQLFDGIAISVFRRHAQYFHQCKAEVFRIHIMVEGRAFNAAALRRE